MTVKKNKVAPPFRICEFDIMYNQGISRSGDVLDIAVLENIVDKRGAFYSYGDTRLAQGRENAKTFLEANLDMMLEIENKVREAKGLPIIDPIMTAAAEKVKAEKKAVSKPAPKSKASSTDKQAAFELEDDDLPTDVDLD